MSLLDNVKKRVKKIAKQKEIEKLASGNKIPLEFKDQLTIEVNKPGEPNVQHNSKK